MITSPMPATLRRWVERRLLSAEPSCDSFDLRYLNDGSPLVTLSVPQGGKLEKVVDRLVEELEESSKDHALTSDGMHRFSVEAFGPRPERRSIGSCPFVLVTSGAGAYAKQLPSPSTDDVLPSAFDALEKLAPNGALGEVGGGRMHDLAQLLAAIQNASGSAVPAATLKVGLDYARDAGRMVLELVPVVMRLQNETIQQLSIHMETMRSRDIDTHELLGELLINRDARKAEAKTSRKREKLKAARMERLMNTGEALLPDLIEQFTGESVVIELLNSVDETTFAAFVSMLKPGQRQLIDKLVEKAKRRADKIKNAKVPRETKERKS